MPQLNADVDYTLTTKQLAALAGVNPGTINASLRRTGSYFGLLPMRLVNRRLMWPANSKELLARGKHSPQPAESVKPKVSKPVIRKAATGAAEAS